MKIELLKLTGIDYDDAMERFLNNEQLYEKFLLKFLDSKVIDHLKEMHNILDYEKMFEDVHQIKGMTGSLSMKTLYQKFCELTEVLRHKEYDKCEEIYQEAVVEYDKNVVAIRTALE